MVAMLMLFETNCCAQNFEHFDIEVIGKGVRLVPTFNQNPKSGVNGMKRDRDVVIPELIKKVLITLPDEIKQKVVEQDIWVSFLFNSKGQIFYMNFYVRACDGCFMTDKQWLKLYHTIQSLKLDLSKFDLLENFEWGSGGMYPVSKYLRNADN